MFALVWLRDVFTVEVVTSILMIWVSLNILTIRNQSVVLNE